MCNTHLTYASLTNAPLAACCLQLAQTKLYLRILQVLNADMDYGEVEVTNVVAVKKFFQPALKYSFDVR